MVLHPLAESAATNPENWIEKFGDASYSEAYLYGRCSHTAWGTIQSTKREGL